MYLHSVCFVTVCTVIYSCNYGVILQFCSVPPVSFFCNVPPCTVFATSRIRVELSLVVHFFFFKVSLLLLIFVVLIACFSCTEISFTVLLTGSIG